MCKDSLHVTFKKILIFLFIHQIFIGHVMPEVLFQFRGWGFPSHLLRALPNSLEIRVIKLMNLFPAGNRNTVTRAIRCNVQLEDPIAQFAHHVLVYDIESLVDQRPTLGVVIKNLLKRFPFRLRRTFQSKNLDNSVFD